MTTVASAEREYKSASTAIVLAGGESVRMGSLFKPGLDEQSLPKALVRVSDKPLLLWVLKWLKRQGVGTAVVGIAYQKDVVGGYLEKDPEVQSLGLKIETSEHQKGDETGRAFRKAIKDLDEFHIRDQDVVAMYGDELIDIDMQRVWDFHLKSRTAATVVVAPMISPFGHVRLDKEESGVVHFIEKPLLADDLVSTGVFVFNRERILPFIPDEKGKIEILTFPQLARERQLVAYKLHASDDWASVDTPKDIDRAVMKLKSWGWTS